MKSVNGLEIGRPVVTAGGGLRREYVRDAGEHASVDMTGQGKGPPYTAPTILSYSATISLRWFFISAENM
jgi:hypothetical protein